MKILKLEMKTWIQKSTLLLATLQLAGAGLTIHPAFASNDGGYSGGGGDAVTLPNDTVVLADPYIRRYGRHNRMELHPMLVAELQRIDRLLVRYGAKRIPRLEFRESGYGWREYEELRKKIDGNPNRSEFMQMQVFDKLVEYQLVSAIPDLPVCQNRTPLKDGVASQQVACTDGAVTWLREDLFRKMSVREQAKTIVHERLRAVYPPISHEFIADITDGIEVLLTLFNEQLNGQKPVLTQEQVGSIQYLMQRLAQISLGDRSIFDNFQVATNGGGLIHPQAKLAEDAYIGIGAVAGKYTFLGKGTLLNDTDCSQDNLLCHLDEEAVLSNLSLRCRVLFDSSSAIMDVFPYWGCPKTLVLKKKASMSHGVLTFFTLELASDSRVKEVTLIADTIRLGNNAKITNTDLAFWGIRLRANATVSNVSVDGRGIELQLKENASFLNLPKVSAVEAFSFLPPQLILKKNASIDANNEPVCMNKKDGHLKIHGIDRIKNLDDLRDLCN